jgi:hypothetical protein
MKHIKICGSIVPLKEDGVLPEHATVMAKLCDFLESEELCLLAFSEEVHEKPEGVEILSQTKTMKCAGCGKPTRIKKVYCGKCVENNTVDFKK